MGNTFLTSLFEYKAWANRGLYALLQNVPAGEHVGEMAVIALTLDHVARVDQVFKARLCGEPEGLDRVVAQAVPDWQELAARVAAIDGWYVDYTKRATKAELEEPIDFTFLLDGEPGHMTREEMLGHVLTHGNSHRGAVGQMMSQLRIKGAPDMLTSYLSRDRVR